MHQKRREADEGKEEDTDSDDDESRVGAITYY